MNGYDGDRDEIENSNNCDNKFKIRNSVSTVFEENSCLQNNFFLKNNNNLTLENGEKINKKRNFFCQIKKQERNDEEIKEMKSEISVLNVINNNNSSKKDNNNNDNNNNNNVQSDNNNHNSNNNNNGCDNKNDFSYMMTKQSRNIAKKRILKYKLIKEKRKLIQKSYCAKNE